jgi:D-beta-D-heptose 7-phosphate kinase/D-beta-D-heptose 1-phosphate adenosyltransferase
MAMCRGFSLQESADIAFKAGTLYVLNKHNKPLDRFSIIHSIDPIGAKVIPYDEINMFCNRDYKLVFTNGCFDIMHMGHIDCLKFAKSQGDKLVVGLNSDESVARLKPKRPIMSVKDRASVLAACEYVDYVVVFDDDTPLELIKKISPDVLVKGADYKEEDVVGYKIVPEIKRCPLVEGISTTSIIEKIKKL